MPNRRDAGPFAESGRKDDPMVRRHVASIVAAIALCGAAMLWITIGDDAIEATSIAASPSDGADDGTTLPTIASESTGSSAQQRALLADGIGDASPQQEWTPYRIDADSASLTIRAIDPAGRPIPGASLSCAAFGLRFERLAIEALPGLAIARADHHGIATWSARRDELEAAGITSSSADRTHLVFVIAAPGFRADELRHTVVLGTAVDRGDVTLTPGVTLEGRVIDADGAPAIGAVIVAHNPRGSSGTTSFRSPFGWQRPYARTDRQGAFVLDGLPRTELVVAAFQTHRAIDSTSPAGRSGILDLRDGLPATPITIQLDRGAPSELSLRGVVRDREGRPIPGVMLRVDGTDAIAPATGLRTSISMVGGFPISMVTDEQGTFACACAPAFADRVRDDVLSLHVRDPHWRFAERRVAPVALGQTELSIELDPVRTIEVACFDSSRVPLPACEAVVALSVDVGNSQVHRVSAGPDAASLHVPMPSSPFYVRVGRRGFRFTWLGPLDPAVAPREIDVVLERHPGIRGVVTSDGLPVAGARVVLSVDDAKTPTPAGSVLLLREVGIGTRVSMDTTLTDERGAFELYSPNRDGFEHPRAARDPDVWTKAPLLTVRSATRGVASSRLPVSAWSEPTDVGVVALTPGATLRGRIVGAHDRRPLLLDRGDTTVIVAPVSADGSFVVDGLGPGVHAFGRAQLSTRDVTAPALDVNRPRPWFDRCLTSTPGTIEMPEAGTVDVELTVEPPPTPLRIAFDWGGFGVESIAGRLAPLDDPRALVSSTPPGWNATLAWPVQVDQPGRFAFTLRVRSAGADVIVTDTITLVPGVPASWDLSAALAEVTLPVSTTPHRSGASEALTQSVRAGCSVTTTVVRHGDGFRPVHAVVGHAGRVIRLPTGTNPWLTPAVLESAETLSLVPAPLPKP